jgi:hypothetical protein
MLEQAMQQNKTGALLIYDSINIRSVVDIMENLFS